MPCLALLQAVVTDASWRVTEQGPVREGDFLMGETYDATAEACLHEAMGHGSSPGVLWVEPGEVQQDEGQGEIQQQAWVPVACDTLLPWATEEQQGKGAVGGDADADSKGRGAGGAAGEEQEQQEGEVAQEAAALGPLAQAAPGPGEGEGECGPRLQALPCTPIIRLAELPARDMWEAEPGVWVFDLGQNFAGGPWDCYNMV